MRSFFRKGGPCKFKQRLTESFVDMLFSNLIFRGLLFFLLLFQLFIQKTMAVTGGDGLIAVDTKHFGNKILIELKIDIN